METYLVCLAVALVGGLMLSRLTKLIHLPAVTAYLVAGLLLVCMMTGTIFCNICDASEELMSRVESWTMPLNILFFVISGAELELQVLAQPAGKYFGSFFSCRLTAQSKPITENLGITLLPQAGVALGMALTAASLPDGALARNVVLFAVLVYELIGPALTKRSLLAVGEIRPKGRTSARTLNAED